MDKYWTNNVLCAEKILQPSLREELIFLYLSSTNPFLVFVSFVFVFVSAVLFVFVSAVLFVWIRRVIICPQ